MFHNYKAIALVTLPIEGEGWGEGLLVPERATSSELTDE